MQKKVKGDLNVQSVAGEENWYALFVMTGEEDNVKERLTYRFNGSLRFLVPKRKIRERKGGSWHEVVKTLFPGYVLMHGQIGVSEYWRFRDTPGLLKLLKSEHELLRIEPYEMEMIGRLTYDDEIIGISDVFIENQRVIVVDGPLLSMEGRIISVNKRKGRVKIQVDFLGESRVIELGINILQPAE